MIKMNEDSSFQKFLEELNDYENKKGIHLNSNELIHYYLNESDTFEWIYPEVMRCDLEYNILYQLTPDTLYQECPSCKTKFLTSKKNTIYCLNCLSEINVMYYWTIT